MSRLSGPTGQSNREETTSLLFVHADGLMERKKIPRIRACRCQQKISILRLVSNRPIAQSTSAISQQRLRVPSLGL